MNVSLSLSPQANSSYLPNLILLLGIFMKVLSITAAMQIIPKGGEKNQYDTISLCNTLLFSFYLCSHL